MLVVPIVEEMAVEEAGYSAMADAVAMAVPAEMEV
jgi:hypothetical protein